MHIYLRSLDRFLFSGASGVLEKKYSKYIFRHVPNVCVNFSYPLKRNNQQNISDFKRMSCLLIAVTSLIRLSLSIFLTAPSVSLHPWERIRCLLSGHVSRAVGLSALNIEQLRISL